MKKMLFYIIYFFFFYYMKIFSILMTITGKCVISKIINEHPTQAIEQRGKKDKVHVPFGRFWTSFFLTVIKWSKYVVPIRTEDVPFK